MRRSVGIKRSANRADALFQIEDKSVGGVAIQVVTMESLAAEEAQALVQLYRGGVGDFGFEDDLTRDTRG